MKDIYFYSPIDHFSQWDWRSLNKGIGGSETSHIILAQMLSRRGYNVTSYAPIPNDCPGEFEGVKWLNYKEADTSKPGLWIIYRSPKSVDLFEDQDQEIWLICQDVDYATQWNEDRIDKIDKIIALCPEQVRYLKDRHKIITDVYLSGNGVRSDLVQELKKENIKRNPKRLIYSSSPDRGLVELLQIFNRAYEQDKELELHCFYGLENLEKLSEHYPSFKKIIDKIKSSLDQPGVYWHAKVSQGELYREFLKSGIWCYPTWFSETSGITCMEAQALGAIPVTRPYWGLVHNVKYGVFIQGDPRDDALVRARYVDAILSVANSSVQNNMRNKMMNDVVVTHNWQRICDQWECWINNFDSVILGQQLFQYKHFEGKVLNIGSGLDVYDLKHKGDVTNLDIYSIHPLFKSKINHDIIGDARNLPESLFDRFDTVVLGDILEHMSKEDGIKTLEGAKKCLVENGRVIITCPEDYRTLKEQVDDDPFSFEVSEYTDECSTHHRLITKKELLEMLELAYLFPFIIHELEYAWFKGWGIVANDSGK